MMWEHLIWNWTDDIIVVVVKVYPYTRIGVLAVFNDFLERKKNRETREKEDDVAFVVVVGGGDDGLYHIKVRLYTL